MNARELRDATEDFIEKGVNRLCYDEEYGPTILRALDLLVAVEESEYEMVLDLLAAAKLHRLAICYKAAAALVAQDAVIRELKEERYAERDARRKEEARGDNLRRERDSLKRHAEAMHDKGKIIVNGHGQVAAIEAMEAAITAYRRDHPKEEA